MSTQSGFLAYLCAQRLILSALHVMLWVVLLLNTAAYFVVQGNPSTRVIIAFNYVGIVLLLVGSGLVLLKCRKVETE